MPYYNICPHCGSHLDPGERCDCQSKGPEPKQRESADKTIIGKSACRCEECAEFTAIGEGDHICGADPHKMPVSEYTPTEDYFWCKGAHFSSLEG